MMEISPDLIVFLKIGDFTLNATIVFTWIVMGLLVITAWYATRRLSVEPPLSHWQNLLEIVITYIREQIREITLQQPDRYLPFLGTLFLFIAVSNMLAIVPVYSPPTGSLSTTAALAICVFLAVPVYGIARDGFIGYLKHYSQPTVFMIPFHIINELSRTLSMAVRLFGNIMSGSMILAILLSITPLFVPIVMEVLGMLRACAGVHLRSTCYSIYSFGGTRTRGEGAIIVKCKINYVLDY